MRQGYDYQHTKNRFEERSYFIKENFPGGKSEHTRIIESALDGFKVLEKRDDKGNLEGLVTYTIGLDRNGKPYCALGVIVVAEELRGEGLADELFQELITTARTAGCDHISAKAETSFGESFLERVGFDEVTDPASHRDYYRFELE